MTFPGRFGDTSGSPHLEGHLVIPHLGIATDVSFLVDTGADTTTLMPMDGDRLPGLYESDKFKGLDDANLGGIGGSAPGKVVGAHLFILDADYLHRFDIDLRVLVPTSDDHGEFPSLLGRDVLRRMKMVSDYVNRKLSFTIRESDGRQAVVGF